MFSMKPSKQTRKKTDDVRSNPDIHYGQEKINNLRSAMPLTFQGIGNLAREAGLLALDIGADQNLLWDQMERKFAGSNEGFISLTERDHLIETLRGHLQKEPCIQNMQDCAQTFYHVMKTRACLHLGDRQLCAIEKVEAFMNESLTYTRV
eukprot:g5072.t1